MSIRKGGQIIAGTPNITTGHHVGEIFWTSRLDNELNGAVDADGAIYSVEAFTGDKSVPELLRKGSLPYVSMSEYESIVSAYGSCRAWGWDNSDTFRVPTLKDVYLMAGQAESAGEFISESLPNIKGDFDKKFVIYEDTGTVKGTGMFSSTVTTANSYHGWSQHTGINADIKANASDSSSTYQDGAKVRPDSVRYRAMVQLSVGVKEDASQLKEYKLNNPHFFGESMWTDIDPMNSSWLISNGNFHSGATYGDFYKWLTSSLGKDHIKGMTGYAFKKQDEDVRWWTAKRNPEVGDVIFGGQGIQKLGVVNKVNSDGTIGFYEDAYSIQQDNLVYTESENINVEGTGFSNLVWANDYDWIINQDDQTFRLPLKTKLASGNAVAGNGMTLGLQGLNGQTGGLNMGSGAVSAGVSNYGKASGSTTGNDGMSIATVGVTTDPEKSGIETSSNGLKLYFYVGDTLQDPAVINVGVVLDYFSKIDTVHCVVDTFKSGSSWYRVYDDGWVEQGGVISASTTGVNQTIAFLKPFADTNYIFTNTPMYDGQWDTRYFSEKVNARTNASVTIVYQMSRSWFACGYGA